MSNYQANIITKNPATPTGPNANGSAPGMWRMEEVAYWVKQGLWPNPNIMSDPYFQYVSMLLSTTSLGNANNNLFVDSSGAFNPISRNGNTTQGSVTPYSANWSNYFDGSGDYLTSTSANTANAMGTGDWTVEGWIYRTSGASDMMIFDTVGVSAGSADYIRVYLNSTGTISFYRYATPVSTTTSSIPVGTWGHFAVVRQSGAVKIYINGVQGNTTYTDTGVNYTCSASRPSIGINGFDNASNPFAGYISNIRAVKGAAVYTSNFTPSTTPLTAISGTSLLTCQSNRFRDASTNNFTITRNGDTRVTDFAPFSPGNPGITYNQSDITNWSGYFDGSGDYLAVPSTSALPTANQAYTIEAWIYPTTINTNNGVIGWGTYGTTNAVNAIKITSTQIFNYWWANDLAGNFTFTAGQWYHIVAQFDGTTRSLYVNGTRLATDTPTGHNVPSPVTNATIGVTNSTEYFTGSISNVRVITGQAIYSGASFTVPTSPLTAISGTSLLTLQNAAFTDNSTNNFVITPNGNTTVTGNSPFNTVGYWSNYFDGSGDYLQMPSNAAFAFGTGDYTIEGWIYVTVGGLDQRVTWFSDDRHNIDINTSNQIFLYDGAIRTFGTVTVGTWNHFAVSRTSGTVSCYLNGVRGYNASETTNSSTRSMNIAANNAGNGYFNGYISNIRVVKGTGVYSGATITVPTTPLTAITNTSLLTCQNGRFIDNSTNAFTITANGNTSIQSFDPFYTSTIASNGGSMYFDGSGDYLAVPNAANLQFGTSNFTVECWFNSNVATTDVHNTIIGKWGTNFNTTGDWAIRSRFSNGNQATVTLRYSSGWYDMTTGINITDGAWHHLAFVRENSTTLKFYVDGVVGATRTISASDIVGSAATLSIGGPAASASGEAAMTGYVSNARITNGSALYTATFTPNTSVLTPSGNTTLLVNGMNAGIFDAAAINDMETVGNAQVTTAVSKYGGSSVYFDGTGDYLVVPNNAELQMGSGDFTIEFWWYPSSISGYQTPIEKGYTSSGGLLLQTGAGDGKIIVYASGSGVITASTAVTLSTWNHMALVRSGTSLVLYLNGTSVGSATNSTNFNNTGVMGIGANASGGGAGAYPINGYMDDVRITKGYARYTSNFTPPTQAFPTY